MPCSSGRRCRPAAPQSPQRKPFRLPRVAALAVSGGCETRPDTAAWLTPRSCLTLNRTQDDTRGVRVLPGEPAEAQVVERRFWTFLTCFLALPVPCLGCPRCCRTHSEYMAGAPRQYPSRRWRTSGSGFLSTSSTRERRMSSPSRTRDEHAPAAPAAGRPSMGQDVIIHSQGSSLGRIAVHFLMGP